VTGQLRGRGARLHQGHPHIALGELLTQRLAEGADAERHLQPVGNQDILRSSVVITIATLIGHLIPLVPFVFLSRTPALVLAVILSAVVLFGVGAYQAVTRVGSWWKQGPRMVLIGLGAAALGFAIGRLFHASGA
jgi:predicted membrane protein (TIGR00267 family)